MAKTSKIITDLIDRLEVKIEVDLVTPELLEGVQRRLDALEVLQSPTASKEYQYALELQALIYGQQGKDDKAQHCIDAALAQAGSPKKLRSRVLKSYVRTHPANVVSAVTPKSVSSAADISMLSEREQKFMRSHGLEGAPDIAFFVRKPAMAVPFALFTSNLYNLYWFYRNWRLVRDATGQDIRPFWRTVFSIFYAWPMFRMMILQAKLRGFTKHYSGGWLALGYVLPGFLVLAIPRSVHYGKVQLLVTSVVVGLISISMVLLAQQAAIYNNLHLTQKAPANSPRGKFEVLYIVLAVILAAFTYSTLLRTPNTEIGGSPIQQFKISNAKVRVQTLTNLYQTCATDLRGRRASVDVHDQTAVKSFNAEYDQCAIVQEELTQAVNNYNKLTGVK